MFNLCKNVKIYHTHSQIRQHQGPNDPHQIRFNDDPCPSCDHNIRMVESHSLSPKKNRTGINLSLKDSSFSPSKNTEKTLEREDSWKTHHQRHSSESNSISSQISNFRFQHYHRINKEIPKIVQSKITYEEMSPRLKSKDSTIEISTPKTMEESLPSEINFTKVITKTTLQSSQNSHEKVNPLKKSTSFLRSSRAKDETNPKESQIQNSFNNSIDFKFSHSRLRREDATESLLRLSCSSYTDILDRPHSGNGFQDFSQACSLELKKNESCFLQDYVCEVDESVILQKQGDKHLSRIQSNYDMFYTENSDSFHEVHSIIIGKGRQSPVQKLKKRYGQNLLHPYDKETLESKSFISRSQNDSKTIQIIDQSYIIQHQIQSKFHLINGSQINQTSFRMFLAKESTIGILISIKELQANAIEKVNQELGLYREIQGQSMDPKDVKVSRLYQMYTHGNIFVLVKQPYEMTLNQFIQRHNKEYVLISWQFIFKNIEEAMIKTIKNLGMKGLFLRRQIEVEDIVYVSGEWKLHSPDMFSMEKNIRWSAEKTVELLISNIMTRLDQNQG